MNRERSAQAGTQSGNARQRAPEVAARVEQGIRPDHVRGRSAALTSGRAYLAGLYDIHKLKYSTAVTVLVVVGFNLVMLWLLEVPLACFVIAPDWTPRAIARARAWVSRHAHVFAGLKGAAGRAALAATTRVPGSPITRPQRPPQTPRGATSEVSAPRHGQR
jgi:hypothetical protein